jgi:DhnA family fructose-bisphosphate aldolase class Ia
LTQVIKRRLNKFKTSEGNYFIFALDHGFSSGFMESIENLSTWLDFASRNNIPGIVVHKGIVKLIQPNHKYVLAVQSMGRAFSKNKYTARRTMLIDSNDVISLGADMVSVQIGLSSNEYDKALYEISKLSSEAHKLNIPVLAMISIEDITDIYRLSDFIIYLNQIGVDLIKIPYLSNIEKNDLNILKVTILNSVPIISAGGELNNSFEDYLEFIKNLGLSGVCIGRNIFHSENPLKQLEIIKKVFP